MQALLTPRCYPSFSQRPLKPLSKVAFGADKSSKDSDDDVKSTSSKLHASKSGPSDDTERSGHAHHKQAAATDTLHRSSDTLPSAKEQHQAMADADHTLKATSRWLDQFDQPTGKLPKLPAAPPSATFMNTDALQKEVNRGGLSGFSNSFEHTLTQVNAAQGQNVNLYLQQRLQEVKLRQRLELELVLRSSLDQGANRYALYTETRRQFKNTRTNPLNKTDIRLAFKYIGAPIHPVGLLVWRVRQFFKQFSKGSSQTTAHRAQ